MRKIAICALLLLSFLLTSCSLFPTKPPAVTTDAPTTSHLTPYPVTSSPITTEAPVTTAPPVTDVPTTTAPKTPSVHQPGRELGSGYLLDSSKLKLKLMLEWKAVDGKEPGTADITVTVYLACYSIFVGARDDSELNVGGEAIRFATPQLEIGGSAFNENNFGTYTFTVKKTAGEKTELPCDAKWHFHGEYAGIPVDWVEVSGTISFAN